MIQQSKIWYNIIIFAGVVILSLFGLTITSFGDDGHKQERMQESSEHKTTGNLPPGQRIIYGTVEGVNEATIKVDSGEAGEMSPRYLELEKLGEKADSLKPGDRLKITVNNKNKVVDYQLIKEDQ